MNRIARVFAVGVFVAGLIGPGCLTSGGAPTETNASLVAERLRIQFPLMSNVVSGERLSAAAHADFRLAADGSIALRRSRNAGVDALRVPDGGGERDVLIVDTPESVRSLLYRVVATAAVAEYVIESGDVHFLSVGPGAGIDLPAPFVVDSSGRPSIGAWSVERHSGEIFLRLQITDRALRYPISISYSGRKGMSRLAPRPSGVLSGGSISGLVLNAAGGGVSGAWVFVFDSGGTFVTFATTDSSGAYAASELGTDSYRVAVMAVDYVTQLYSGISCPDLDCTISSGAAVNVTDGVNTPNINFTLTSNVALITGRILGPGAVPLGNIPVVAYDGTGFAQGFGVSDELTGAYHLSVPFGGTFYARTFNSVYPGLLDQLYSGITCTSCDVTTGTAIVVSVGGVRGNVDFNLPMAGGRIAGRVTEAGTATPLQFRRVLIYDSAGVAVSYGETDENGDYISFQALAPGTYFALASVGGYTPQLYDRIACNGCNVTSGTPVIVTAGATTANINFALSNEVTTISGLVSSSTGTPLKGAFVHFHDSLGRRAVTVATGDEGRYVATLSTGGTYYARTQNWQFEGYVDQVYSAIDCSGCPVTEGTAITVITGERRLNVDFALAKNGGSITGLIRDAGGASLPGFVQVYGSTGELATYGFAAGNGQYSLIDGLTTGSFYVIGGAPGYSSQIYLNITCGAVCDPTSGQLVPVTEGQTTPNVNFTLGGSNAGLAGHVRNSDGEPLGGVNVQVYDSAGTLVAVASADSSTGTYEVALPGAGTYFAKTNNTAFPQYPDQLYNHLPCDGCNPTTGTPIVATVGTITGGIDFDLTAEVCPALVLAPLTLPDGTIGTVYSQVITEASGEPPVTFAVTLGSLPPGLTLDPGGELTGTPTTAGSYPFTVKATDAAGCTGTATYTIVISAQSTTTTLSVVPTSATYGDTVTLTATVTPNAAEGTVGFIAGGGIVATRTLSGGTATLSTTFFSAGTHILSAAYGGSPTFAPSTSSTVELIVQKATPVITWLTPAPIAYGTPLSNSQLNATANVPGAFVYAPSSGTLDAGTHSLSVTFTPVDSANYNSATANVTLIVNKANQQISWSTPADIVYGTSLSAAQLNATVSVPGPSPAGALTYNPPAGTVLGAGVQTLNVTAAGTGNYNEAHASVLLNVLKATPLFSNLSAPTIVIGTNATVIGGKIAFGSLIPPGNVIITLAGASQTAVIQAGGTFSATFATAALSAGGAGYPIAFSYAGSANFTPANATSILTIVYAFTGGLQSDKAKQAGSTIPISIKVVDAQGRNLSAQTLVVKAYGVRPISSPTWLPIASGGGNDDDDGDDEDGDDDDNNGGGGSAQFRYQNSDGGSYHYNLKTKKEWSAGTHVLGFTIGSDPTIHTIQFFLKK